MQKFNDGRDWFFEKKYGMFIHWGIYALEAWHEQLQWRGHVPREEYRQYMHQFNPTKFDPEQWLDLMEEAGMEYLTFTTKHHDGFCLWDTKETDFNIMNTPYKKDILAQLAEACHRRKMPLCLYFSPIDWNIPFYPAAGRSHEIVPPETDTPDVDRFMEFTRNQVRELCTNYGEIHGFWWDGGGKQLDHPDPSLNNMIRELQPNCIINNRGYDEGDYGTPERDMEECKTGGSAFQKPTQACQAIGIESWGYRKNEDYYSIRYLEKCIDIVMAKGGTYLLNVGPKADGTIAENEKEILRTLGSWYKSVKESFTDVEFCTNALNNPDILTTKRDNALYLHLYQEPMGNRILLESLTQKPVKATLLNNNQELEIEKAPLPWCWRKDIKDPYRVKNIPVDDMAGTIMVIKLELE